MVKKSLQLLFAVRFWAVAALFVLPASSLSIVLPGLGRRRRAAHYIARTLFRLMGIPLKVMGLEYLPEQSCIIASNHQSYLDGPLLFAVLPPRFKFVVKHEVSRMPFIGVLLRRLGVEFVDRFDPNGASQSASRLVQHARGGVALGVFPEGTFFAEAGLRPFRLGAFVAATRAGLPVVPVAIRGTRSILPARCWLPNYSCIEVWLSPRHQATGRNGYAARELRDAVRAAILENCGEPDAYHGV